MGNPSKSTSLEYWLLPTDAVIPEDFWRATLETESEEGRKCNRERERFKEDERDSERERERESERERERGRERERERKRKRAHGETANIIIIARHPMRSTSHALYVTQNNPYSNGCKIVGPTPGRGPGRSGCEMRTGRAGVARRAPAVSPTRSPLPSPLPSVLSV